jgi:glucan 1,3-beta-glucosidase
MCCDRLRVHVVGELSEFSLAVDSLLTDDQSATMWLNNIAHQGKMPYNSDPNYQVFRNVKSFGAKGDGVTDDTAAIK